MEIKSIMTQDFEHCFVCGRPYPQIHHIMNGSNKAKSEEYGLILPLCLNHHTGAEGVHTKPEKMLACKQMAQKKFEETHSREEWREIFGKSYL